MIHVAYNSNMKYSGKRLYWSTTTTLESAALDGSDRKQLMTKSDASIKAVAFLGGSLYYVDMYSRYMLTD